MALTERLGITKARVTQTLSLTTLAPDTQEVILFHEATDSVEPLAERELRAMVRHQGWADQRAAWQRTRAGTGA